MVDLTAPQSAWPVIGHEWAVRLLRQSLAQERLSHAYLFLGVAGVGKTTLARALVQAVLCQADAPADRPCGGCRACSMVIQNRHPDVRLVVAPGPERPIAIEQIRDMQRDASLSPVEGRAKIFILRDLDRATHQAANALLKTLEEPPSRVMLLLTASQSEALLPTVISRCQVIPLRVLPIAVVEDALRERWQVAPEQAALLARLSRGSLGAAVAALGDQQGSAWRQRCFVEMAQLIRGGYVERLQQAEQLSQQAEMVRPTLTLWLGWWRDVMLTQARCEEQIVNIDYRAEVDAVAQQCSPGQVQETIKRLWATLKYLDANVNLRLALETLLLRLPRLSSPSRIM
jgi:DNA polymerase-3 subunit delta'